MDDKFLVNSKKETSSLLQGRSFESLAEFDLYSFEVLSKYVQDKERIRDIVSSKSFAFEVIFIKWTKGTIFEDFIDFFFKNLRTALKYHKNEVLKFYVELDLNIHEALVSYQDSAALASTMNLENKRTVIKSGFTLSGRIVVTVKI